MNESASLQVLQVPSVSRSDIFSEQFKDGTTIPKCVSVRTNLISQGVDIKSKDQLGRDGLFRAALTGQVEIVKLLMSLDRPGNVNPYLIRAPKQHWLLKTLCYQ